MWLLFSSVWAYFEKLIENYVTACLCACLCFIPHNRNLKKKIKEDFWDQFTVYRPLYFSFSIRSVSYYRKVGDMFFPELLGISCYAMSLIQIYLGSKFYPSRLQTVGLRVLLGISGNFSLFSVRAPSKKCPSARWASADDFLCKKYDVFGMRTVSLNIL
jgi:hypothetical protein